jgi:hypothetical protein
VEQAAAVQKRLEHARDELGLATDTLADRRSKREAAEANLADARSRLSPEVERPPSLAVIEELSAFEARIGLSSDAAKRVAERRALDLARRTAKPQ